MPYLQITREGAGILNLPLGIMVHVEPIIAKVANPLFWKEVDYESLTGFQRFQLKKYGNVLPTKENNSFEESIYPSDQERFEEWTRLEAEKRLENN